MKKALFLIGGDFHQYELCTGILTDYFKRSGMYDFTVTSDREALANLDGYDVVFVYTQGGELTKAQERGLCDFVHGGGGLVGIHSATASFQNNDAYMELIGSRFVSHPEAQEIHVQFTSDQHYITRRAQQAFDIFDEFYQLQPIAKTPLHVLATGYWRGEQLPLAYVRDYGAGRVFYAALGHDERAFRHPSFQQLLFRGAGYVTKMQEAAPIRVGIVGYGAAFGMGHHHGTSVNGLAGMEVVAACDLDPSRTAQAAKDFPGIRTYNSADAMAADSEVDLVFVVLPHNEHAPVAIQMLNAGKHVVSEKPMCVTLDEANAMIDAAKRNNKVLSVYHNRRWDSDFLTIRNVIQSKMIGDVYHIETFMGGYDHPGTWWRSDKGVSGGAAHDWGAHFLDWILNLIPDRIETVNGTVHNRVWHDIDNEDHVRIQMRFEGGQEAEFQTSSIAAAGKQKWFILGTKGAITGGWDQVNVHALTNAGRFDGKVQLVKPGANPFHTNLANHLLVGEPLQITAEDARRVIAVIDTAYRSAQTKQPLPFPLDR